MGKHRNRSLAGKTVVISGGASGIGAASATLFASEGAKVAIMDVDVEGGEALASQLGESSLFVKCDHTDKSEVKQAADTVHRTLGNVDILYNNAGVGWTGEIANCRPEELEYVLRSNLTGAWNLSQVFMQDLIYSASENSAGAALLFTASNLGLYAIPKSTAYTMSKHAVVGLMRSLAIEFGPRRVRVNAICPGFVDTAMTRKTTGSWGGFDTVKEAIAHKTPLPYIAEAEDIAEVALFLASDQSRAIHGQTITVDCGVLGR